MQSFIEDEAVVIQDDEENKDLTEGIKYKYL